MAATEKALKDKRLNLRVSREQRDLIWEAAEASQKDLSAFVLEAALHQAQRLLAERRVFQLDEDAWERFSTALDRPVTPLSEKPRLEKLLREPSVLER